MYLNIHHKEMPGSWHLDDGDGTNVTCLLMVQGSGSFEIRRETIVDFVPNRFIVFDASKNIEVMHQIKKLLELH